MTAKQLKNSILQQAIQGKLIKQNKEDEYASELLKRIKAEREKLIKSGKIKINKNISAIYRKGNSFYEKIENEEICIDEELPFEIPKTWEWTKLSFVSDMFTGNSINENEKNLKYKGLSEGYFYVATKDVNFNNEIDYYNGVRIPKNSKKFRIAPKNSILFCVEGGSAGKKIAITDKDICFGNKLCCFVSYGIDIKYLYYYIQSPMFIYDFKRNTTGIIGGVSINTLKQMFLPLPPIEEQKRIVNKLNQLMPLIEEYEEKENKLNELDKKFPERLKKSILKEAVEGKLINQNKEDKPASELLKRIKAEREKLIKSGKIKINKNISAIYRKGNSFYEKIENEEICIDEELPFEIPKTWEWLRLGELCTIINGFTPLRTNPKFWENPTISWFTVNDIHSQGRRIKYTKQSINKCALSDNSSRILPAGTVLICCTASVGEYAITEIPLTTNQQFNGLIINEYYSKYYSSEFLFKIAPTFKAKLFDIAGKTTFNFISVQKLSNLLLPFPPIEEQKRIVEKLDKLINACEELKKILFI